MEIDGKMKQSPKTKKTYKNLFDFLQLHKYDKNIHLNGPTHTRIGDRDADIYGGSYYITSEDSETFHQLYYKDVLSINKLEYLTERQLNDSSASIMVDIDLHFGLDLKERVYTIDHLDDLADLYLAELSKIYQFGEDAAFEIFIFEKDDVNRVKDKNITKDGLHMKITLQMEHAAQMVLRKNIIEKITDCWGDFPIVNTWNDVFDDGISKGYTNWQMYGSRKPHHEPYKLTQVYNITVDPDDGELMNNRGDVSKYMNAENYTKLLARNTESASYFYKTSFSDLVQQSDLSDGIQMKRVKSNNNMDNSFMNIEYGSGSGIISTITNSEELDNYLQRFLETLPYNDYKMKELYEYTMTLPEAYYGNGSYSKWIRVGWALKNTSKRLLILWLAFSAKSASFDYGKIPDLCEEWDLFDIKRDSGVSRWSIIYWAKNANPEGAKAVLRNTVGYYLDNTISSMSATSVANPTNDTRGAGDFDIAMVLYQMLKGEYICSDVKHGHWWRFRKHRWFEIDSGTTLRKTISVELRELYTSKITELQNYSVSLDPESDEDKRTSIKQKVDVALKIVMRLGQTNDKTNIMKESKDLFYDDEFYERLDSNPYLLCCKNGVIDFKQKCFRPGCPEDYLTKCTDINYYPLTSSRHKSSIGEIHDFMEKLFPQKELRDYMWNHLSSILIGKPSLNQSLFNYIGFGRNGKSALTDLMQKVLGTYKAMAPISIISQGRGKVGGLAPEIVALKGCRYVVMQEPDKTDVIHEGPMKELVSGIEPITARAPYMTKAVTFTPQFALVVCCNHLLSVRTQDDGTWRRLKVIPFKSKFTENPVADDPESPYQFKVDLNLMDKYNVWCETMLSMLVEMTYVNQGQTTDCDIVLEASRAYKERQDYLAEFTSDKVCRAEGYSIRKGELSNEFKNWYIVNIGTNNAKPKEIHDYMDKRFGKNIGGIWKNVKIKLYDESDFGEVIEEQQEEEADNIEFHELE
jgi:P4 family phage/plasmid primase-like protien